MYCTIPILPLKIDSPEKCYVHIIVAQWHRDITMQLYQTALCMLTQHQILEEHITKMEVPGTYEIPLAAQWSAQKSTVQVVICLGCLIQGDTPHFDYISRAVTEGLTQVALKWNKPVLCGILTTYTYQQAKDRAFGTHNTGSDVAKAALQMLQLKQQY